MLHIALVEPEIPPNTGNIARLCAATGTQLHIVGVTGFRMDDRTLKRSGLDYWNEVDLSRHVDIGGFVCFSSRFKFRLFDDKGDKIIYRMGISGRRLPRFRPRNTRIARRPFERKYQ